MKVFKFLSPVLGILGGGKSPKASGSPVKAAAPIADVESDKASTAKAARATLYETAGGATGQELNPDQVKKRQTLLGN